MRVPKGYLTMREAARRMAVSYRSIMAWRKQGKIETVRRLKDRLVAVGEIDRLMEGT